MIKFIDFENYLNFKKGLEELYNKWIEIKPSQLDIHTDIVEYFENNEMPSIILEPNYCFDFIYPFFMFAKSKKLGVCDIDIELIGGHNCSSVRKEIPSSASRVWNSLVYILGLSKEEFKPIQLYKINKDYYISNGKHRFYAHLLLGKSTIRAEVTEYDYCDFIQNAYIEEYFGDHYLYYKEEIQGMHIEDDEKKELVHMGIKYLSRDDLCDIKDQKNRKSKNIINFFSKLNK